MTSGYDARGRRAGVTQVIVTPNFVTQLKTSDGNDGYTAAQIATGSKKSVRKPQMGHFAKANAPQTLRYVKEIRSDDTSDLSLGQEIKISDIFKVGDIVRVTGVSKGKGFQGGVKRHGFHGGPKTHGQSDRHRAPGSIGSGTTPGRVLKGKKMAGHMGSETASVRNLEIIGIDKKTNIMSIKGGIPGPIGGLVSITRLGVVKGYTPPPEPEPEEELPSDVEQMQGAETVEQSETPVVEESAAPAEDQATGNTDQVPVEAASEAAPEPVQEAAAEEPVVETSEEKESGDK